MKHTQHLFFCSLIILTAGFSGCKRDNVFETYAKPEITIRSGDTRLKSQTIHLSGDTVYILASNLNVNTGQVLKVDAGTLVKVNDQVLITINPGARIEAHGTADAPIVFTSSAAKGSAGFVDYQNNTTEHAWFGISVYGNYPAPVDSSSTGTGIMSYVRIEFAGGSYKNFQGYPALLLQDVGRGTVINNIEVSYSVAYSSFQIFGGNFDASNLVSYASGGSDFELNSGYTGMMQNILAYRHPYFSPMIGSGTTVAGLQITGDNTFPVISNLTVIGPDEQPGTNPKYRDTTIAGPFGTTSGSRVAAIVMVGGKFRIRNSAIMGFPKGGLFVDRRSTAVSLQTGGSELAYSFMHSNDGSRAIYLTPGAYPPYTSNDFRNLLLQPKFGNQVVATTSDLMLTSPYSYDKAPNPAPKTGSPLLTGANFDDAVFGNPFFTKVPYRGAVGAESWLQGWTNFTPLQTDYNH